MNNDEEELRKALMGVALTVRQAKEMVQAYGTLAQKDFVREATEYIARQLSNDPTCNPIQANHYVDELRRLIHTWKQDAPEDDFDGKLVEFTYIEDPKEPGTSGPHPAAVGISTRGNTNEVDIVKAALLINRQAKMLYPEVYKDISERIECVTQMVRTVDPQDLVGKTLGEAIEYLAGKFGEMLQTFGREDFQTKNTELKKIWEGVRETFEQIQKPDDLDMGVYKRLIHLLEETGQDPSPEDIAKMLPEIEKMHNILKKSV